MKPIGIAANLEKPQVLRVAKALLRQLTRLKRSVLLEQHLAEKLTSSSGASMQEIGRRCGLLILLGGDGTVLRAAREVYPHQVPFLPVNLGKLGFLATVTPRQLAKVIPIVLKGEGQLIYHSTLKVSIHHGQKVKKGFIALNDAVISRGAISRVVELELWVDGQFLNSYLGDGMIFSTTTGSTAYSLSAGGPIIVPHARVYTITPICPHTLSNRSVIVADESIVETRIKSLPDELFLGLDGQEMIRLDPNDRVKVTIGQYRVPMVTLPGKTFFELLRRKLRWVGSNI